jgi:hypothetical protein
MYIFGARKIAQLTASFFFLHQKFFISDIKALYFVTVLYYVLTGKGERVSLGW